MTKVTEMTLLRKRKHLVGHTWTLVVDVVDEALHFDNSSGCTPMFGTQYWLDQMVYESSVSHNLSLGLCLTKN